MERIGLDDLCPCGSGRNYGHCCSGSALELKLFGLNEEFAAEVRRALRGKRFATRAEARAFIVTLAQKRNSTPRDFFCGLTPGQVHGLMRFPFHSPEVVTFPSCIEPSPSAPILTLFQRIVDAIGDRGLKPTATGNLPVKVVREAALEYWSEEEYYERTRFGAIHTETNFHELHVVRLIADLAELICMDNGKLVLTRECRDILDGQGMAGIYPRLLHTAFHEFNWTEWDRYPTLEIIRDAFLVTLYILKRRGDRWRDHSFYEAAFLRAFPMAVSEVAENTYPSREALVSDCYSWRCLRGFARFLGLVEIKAESVSLTERRFKVRKLPLLDQAVVFHIDP